MASTPTFSPNPYANFDPSQWNNPYSPYQNQALPFPSTYAGWPTDAMGRPIQPLPGMTLNSAPAAAAQPAAATGAPDLSGLAQQMQLAQMNQGSFGGTGQVQGQPAGGAAAAFNQANLDNLQRQANMARAAAPAAQPAAPVPQPQAAPGGGGPLTVGSPLTPQQYLQLRANPGYVQTPGATVPQGPTTAQPGPGVLQQFLQNWKPATSGPGSGFQQGFARSLKGMGY